MGVNNKALHPSAPYSSSLWLVLLTTAAALLTLSPAAASAADLYDLVFKGCANQSFPSGGLASQQALASLSSTLIAQSATAKFYKTTASVAGGQPSIFGLFQCRGDLSASDCAACVGRIPAMCLIFFSLLVSRGLTLGLLFDGDSGQPTGKTVAIVVGGAAALGFLVVCLFFVRSLYKKRVYRREADREMTPEERLGAMEGDVECAVLLAFFTEPYDATKKPVWGSKEGMSR